MNDDENRELRRNFIVGFARHDPRATARRGRDRGVASPASLPIWDALPPHEDQRLPHDALSEAATADYFRTRSASDILANLDTLLTGDRVKLGDMVDALGEAGIGLTILMLALPSFIPIPGLPTGFVFGTALAILALQIMTGADRLLLPEWLRERSLPRGPVVTGGAWVAPWFRRVEWLLRPRLNLLSGRLAHVILAIPIFVHAVMILLPIPLGNQLPALAVIVFAFGLIERDGLAVLIGWLISIVAIAWNSAIILFGAELSMFLYRWSAEALDRLPI